MKQLFKHDPDAIDAAQIEGRWQVESIRYEGTLDDGTAISAEPEHCDIFWTGDIIEFKGDSIYMGERLRWLHPSESGHFPILYPMTYGLSGMNTDNVLT